MHPIWQSAQALSEEGQAYVLVLVIRVDGHAPQRPGARMLVRQDGTTLGTIGGGAMEHDAIARALEVLQTGVATTARYVLGRDLDMTCGGGVEVFLEPVFPRPRVVLLGGGHVAQATAPAALAVGFDVLVIDGRDSVLAEASFPEAVEVRHQDPLAALRALELRADDLVIVCTHDHALDKRLLAQALPRHAGYLGMIGSQRKVRSTVDHLRAQGVPQADIDRVHMPIGLDIYAENPAEIAVAITGELIRFRRAPRSQKTTRGAPVQHRRETVDA